MYEIDGARFSTLEEFFDEISRVLIPGAQWGHGLNSFNDILRGGFGTPDDGYILVWKNSDLSRDRLGYSETVRQLSRNLKNSQPWYRQSIEIDLNQAMNRMGPTVFDWLVEIIRIHCRGGAEEEDNVELILQ